MGGREGTMILKKMVWAIQYMAQTMRVDGLPGNARQSYFAEILPDALEIWKSFRKASQ